MHLFQKYKLMFFLKLESWLISLQATHWLHPVVFLKYKIIIGPLPTLWFQIETIFGLIMKNNTTAKH